MTPTQEKWLRETLEAHKEVVAPILADGDAALVLGKMCLACPLIDRLRGSEPGPVVRLTRERIVSALEPGDPEDLRAFLLGAGAASRRCVVAAGGAYFYFHFEVQRHLKPCT